MSVEQELIDIGIKMAQTIQEFADDIKDSDPKCDVSDLQNIVDEWEEIYKKTLPLSVMPALLERKPFTVYKTKTLAHAKEQLETGATA